MGERCGRSETWGDQRRKDMQPVHGQAVFGIQESSWQGQAGRKAANGDVRQNLGRTGAALAGGVEDVETNHGGEELKQQQEIGQDLLDEDLGQRTTKPWNLIVPLAEDDLKQDVCKGR